jgi:multiple sugar transport system permease protein
MPRTPLRSAAETVLSYSVLSIVGVLCFLPFFWTVSTALKTNPEIFSRQMVWLPAAPRWENFRIGWTAISSFTFTTFFKNSLVLVLINLVGYFLSSTLVAYGFARMKFALRRFWFIVLLATMMLPAQVTMVPTYILWSRLGFVNTYLPLTLPSFLGEAFYIFLMRQFIITIPTEIDEAAFCDGCSKFGIYARFILPLSKPALFTVLIFSFSDVYESFMMPLIYLNSPKLFPVSLALRLFFSNDTIPEWGPIHAMVLVAMLPLLISFILGQRALIQGITTTGLKG